MAYANPRKLNRDYSVNLLLRSKIHGKASIRLIELGEDEKAIEQARLAARCFLDGTYRKRGLSYIRLIRKVMD